MKRVGSLHGCVPLDRAGYFLHIESFTWGMLIPAAAVLQAKERNLAIGEFPQVLPSPLAFIGMNLFSRLLLIVLQLPK